MLEWSIISDIFPSKTATKMYMSTNSLAPEYQSKIFVKNSALNTLRLRNNEADLIVSLFETSNGQKSITFRGPKVFGTNVAQMSELHPPFLPPKGS